MPNSPPSREDVLKTLDIYRRLRPKPEGTIGRVLQDTVLAGPRILRRIGPFPMSDQLAECLKRLAGYCASVGIPAGALVDAAADMDGKRQRVWDAADVAVAALEGWVARSATGEAPDAKRPEAATAIASAPTPAQPKPKGRPRNKDIEQKVRNAIGKLRESGKPDQQITRDMVVTKSGVSAGKVSASRPWQALKALKAQAKGKDGPPSITGDEHVDEAIQRADWEEVKKAQNAEENHQYRYGKSRRQ
jgi:hypothetical protein